MNSSNRSSAFDYAIFALIVVVLILTNLYQVSISDTKGVSIKNIGLYIVLLALLGRYFGNIKALRAVPAVNLLVAILVLAAFSLLYAPLLANGALIDRLQTMAKYKNELVYPFLMYLFGFMLISSRLVGRKLIAAYATVFSSLNILALSVFVTGIDPFSINVLSHEGTRFASFGGISNQGAYAVIFLIPICFYLFETSASRAAKVLFLSFIIINILSIGFTGSRGGMLLLVLVLGGLAFATNRVRLFLLLFTISAIGLVGYATLFDSEFLTRALGRLELLSGDQKLTEFQASRDYTVLDQISAGRTYIWKSALETLLNDPVSIIMGKGWGTFKMHMAHTIGIPAAAHNMVLKFWLELGVAGAFLLIMSGYRYYEFIKSIAGRNELFSRCLLACFAVVVWTFMLSTPIELYAIWSLGVGLLTGYALQVEKGGHKEDDGLEEHSKYINSTKRRILQRANRSF